MLHYEINSKFKAILPVFMRLIKVESNTLKRLQGVPSQCYIGACATSEIIKGLYDKKGKNSAKQVQFSKDF